jgi:hypothetical protein
MTEEGGSRVTPVRVPRLYALGHKLLPLNFPRSFGRNSTRSYGFRDCVSTRPGPEMVNAALDDG